MLSDRQVIRAFVNMGANAVQPSDDPGKFMMLVSTSPVDQDSFAVSVRKAFPGCSVFTANGSPWVTVVLK